MKTTSPLTFMIGMKSGNIDGIGQKWIPFVSGSDPYGFAGDGQWHWIEIPLSDIADEVDLSAVSQLFQVLGMEGPISDIEFGDIYFTNGGNGRQPVTLTVDKQGTDAVLSFLSDHETNYRLLHKASLTDPHWTVHSTRPATGRRNRSPIPYRRRLSFFGSRRFADKVGGTGPLISIEIVSMTPTISWDPWIKRVGMGRSLDHPKCKTSSKSPSV